MKFIHEKMTFIHMKSFIYGHIWIKFILNFKFQTQSSKFKLYVHAQAILFCCFYNIFCELMSNIF